MKYNTHTIAVLPMLSLVISLSSCYYTTQSYYLFSYTYDNARSIKSVLNDEATDTKTKTFLKTVQTMRQFLQTHIHLNISKNYTTYTALNRDYLVAVVQAAPKFSLEPYMWKYPILGNLPYRGFYNVADAKKEAAKLTKKDYDVLIRPVQAFSTLNFLPDPLYSFMQKYSESELIELIAHEQTHATIWVKKHSNFNEQLANFVAKKSALLYIGEKYGKDSQQYQDLLYNRKNSKAFLSFLYDVKQKLQQVYDDTSLSNTEKLAQKLQVLTDKQHAFMQVYDTRFTNNTYKDVDITKYNNAFFSTILLYEDNADIFETAYDQCGRDITTFVDALKSVKKNQYKNNPYQVLQTMCEN